MHAIKWVMKSMPARNISRRTMAGLILNSCDYTFAILVLSLKSLKSLVILMILKRRAIRLRRANLLNFATFMILPCPLPLKIRSTGMMDTMSMINHDFR